MPVQLSPLLLEGYYVREFSFNVKAGLDSGKIGVMQHGLHLQHEELFNPDPLTINVQSGSASHIEEPYRWMVTVEVKTQGNEEKKVPYDFHVVLVGYFTVHEQFRPENLETVVKVNAASLLVGAARELIAVVTGRGPYPAVVIPSILFTPDVEQDQKQLQAAEEAQPSITKATKGAVKKRASKKSKK
jgi:preprotein translocase subunit SecB